MSASVRDERQGLLKCHQHSRPDAKTLLLQEHLPDVLVSIVEDYANQVQCQGAKLCTYAINPMSPILYLVSTVVVLTIMGLVFFLGLMWSSSPTSLIVSVQCPPGFVARKDGAASVNCIDIDECQTEVERLCTQANATCINTIGTFTCLCNDEALEWNDNLMICVMRNLRGT